ncbi:MAG: type I methionyl aminopeptidase [bacterium]|nr:type I methionyl aminopeptidase [bacterium]
MIIKTEAERHILRECGKRLAEVLQSTAAMVRPGITGMELNEHAHRMIVSRGDTPAFLGHKGRKDKFPFPAVLCVSINGGIVHGVPKDEPIVEGDIVKLDCGIRHEGLYTDSALTVGVGAIAHEDETLLQATKEALDAQIATARSGAALGDIGHAAEAVAKKYKLGFPTVLGGHGVGRAVHEEPFIFNYGNPGEGQKLLENQVVALEPMFSLGSGEIRLADDGWTYEMVDGKHSAHFEHTVIIGTDGAEVITRAES